MANNKRAVNINTHMQWQRSYQANNRLWPNLGHYFNLITSSQNVTYFGLPSQKFTFGETVCLSFSYFTSTEFSRLNVYTKIDDRLNQLIWTSTKPTTYLAHLGSNWKTDFIDIKSSDGLANYHNYEVIFEIIRGPNPVEEMALDEIKLDTAMCISNK